MVTKGIAGVLTAYVELLGVWDSCRGKPTTTTTTNSICAWVTLQRQASRLVSVTPSMGTVRAIQAGILSVYNLGRGEGFLSPILEAQEISDKWNSIELKTGTRQ